VPIYGVWNRGLWKFSTNRGVWQDKHINISREIEAIVENTEQFTITGITSEPRFRGTPSTVPQFSGGIDKLP